MYLFYDRWYLAYKKRETKFCRQALIDYCGMMLARTYIRIAFFLGKSNDKQRQGVVPDTAEIQVIVSEAFVVVKPLRVVASLNNATILNALIRD